MQYSYCIARLAQSVEHQTFKAGQYLSYLRVKGSSPLLGVIFFFFKKEIGEPTAYLILKMFNGRYFAIQTKHTQGFKNNHTKLIFIIVGCVSLYLQCIYNHTFHRFVYLQYHVM